MKKLEVKKFGKLKLNKESLSMLKGGEVLAADEQAIPSKWRAYQNRYKCQGQCPNAAN